MSDLPEGGLPATNMPLDPLESTENEAIELRLLLEAILLKYGYDFRDYSRASLKRRVMKRLIASGASSLSEVTHRVLNDVDFFDSLLGDLSIQVTEMFRDPLFFRALREQVLPALAKRPYLKIWHAGCATGEEVYSMAILLKEAGLLQKTTIFATDINGAAITRTKEGVYSLEQLQKSTLLYQKSGGTGSFGDYYSAKYDSAILSAELKQNMVFAIHNLAVDKSIGEMDIIVCRNVLIYFNRTLQERVVTMFGDTLAPNGVLCLGAKESVKFTAASAMFKEFIGDHRIYRRHGPGNGGRPA